MMLQPYRERVVRCELHLAAQFDLPDDVIKSLREHYWWKIADLQKWLSVFRNEIVALADAEKAELDKMKQIAARNHLP